MHFIEDDIIEILEKRPNECCYIDYKQIPYMKEKRHDFIKDVLAMLNTKEAINKDKYIIIGVEDQSLRLVGIKSKPMLDDADYQEWVNSITPRPTIQTGTVHFNNLPFGYIAISKTNTNYVYEVNTTVIGDRSAPLNERNGIFKGQSMTREGSRNRIITEADRVELRNLVTISTQISSAHTIPLSTQPSENKLILVAMLIGQWNETYPGDISTIEKLTKCRYEDFQAFIQKLYETNKYNITHTDNIWSFPFNSDLMTKLLRYLYDSLILDYFSLLNDILLKIDFKYTLPEDKQIMWSYYAKEEDKEYSPELRTGTTIAIGTLVNSINNDNIPRQFFNELYKTLVSIMDNEDWRVFASLEFDLDNLAEAAPELFIRRVNDQVDNHDSGLYKYLTHVHHDNIVKYTYGDNIYRSLATFAEYDIFFCTASETLLKCSRFSSSASTLLIETLLPWRRVTEASIEKQVNFMKSMMKEDSDATWKILMKLLPKATTSAMILPEPRFMNKPCIPKPQPSYYNELTMRYIEMAINNIEGELSRLIDLNTLFSKVDDSTFNILIRQFETDAYHLTCNEKESLCMALLKLCNRHEKHLDSSWSMDMEHISEIRNLARKIYPDIKKIQEKLLFSSEVYNIHPEIQNPEEKEKRIFTEKQETINRIFKISDIEGILDFAKSVDNPINVGIIFSYGHYGRKATSQIVSYLNQNDYLKDFAYGYFNAARHYKRKALFNDLKEIDDKNLVSEIISIGQQSKEEIEYIKNLPTEAQNIYWKKLSATTLESFNNKTDFDEFISLLNAHNRMDLSLMFLFDRINLNKPFNIKTAYNTLFSYANLPSDKEVDIYHIEETIRWLQDNSKNTAMLCKLENIYLTILTDSSEVKPVNLYNQISHDPDFFIYLLQIIYNHEFIKTNIKNLKYLTEHYFTLLHSWNRIPGIQNDNTLNKDILLNWYDSVMEKSRSLKLENIAKSIIGRIFAHAPEDIDGFFIDKNIASILQEKDNDDMRIGYRTEIINMRGCHIVDKSGKDDFALEEKYRSNATQADEAGFFRLATSLNKIADFYHDSALEIINND